MTKFFQNSSGLNGLTWKYKPCQLQTIRNYWTDHMKILILHVHCVSRQIRYQCASIRDYTADPANNLTYLLLLRSELELECGGESGSNLVTHIVRADDLKVWRIGLGNFHQRQPGDLETNRNASKIKHNPFESFHLKLPPKTDIRTNFNIHKKKCQVTITP